MRSSTVMSAVVLLVLSIFVFENEALGLSRKFLLKSHNEKLDDFPAYWFTQTLDHYNRLDTRTFQQKYYVNDKYWNKVNGPILLYINGEGPISAPPNADDDLVVILAKQHKALIITAEHRYYGDSCPVPDLTTDNLQWLSSEQALADLANFVTKMRTKYQTQYKITEELRIFTIGVSYSGALSAWFRVKYPHITKGSLSSSGVVNAILEFTQFDEQVSASVGPTCANVLRQTTAQLEKAVLHSDANTKKATKAKFTGAEILTSDGDFFLMMSDVMAESVQYGYQDYLCTPMVESYNKNGVNKLIDTLANYSNVYWNNVLGLPIDYNTEHLQDTNAANDKADRQWWYQTCTELAYFQVAPAKNSIRSSIINIQYFKDECKKIFGRPLWPDVNATNVHYGGNKVAGTKIFFANGSQDPWQWAAVRQTLSDSEPAQIVECRNCGHGVDVRGCPNGCDNNENLQAVRRTIAKYVDLWLYDDSP